MKIDMQTRLLKFDKEVNNALRKAHKKEEPFTTVSSNPPYQKDTGNGAIAIYHHIMNVAKLLSENISMIYPARWTSTGRGEGIEEFRETELNSQHYRTFIIESGESAVFEEATIKGGVNYFHWNSNNRNSNDLMKYIYNGISENRKTLLNDMPMMIVDPRFSKIVKKVHPQHHIEIMSRNYYGMSLEADYNIEKLAEKVPENEKNLQQSTKIYYSGKSGGIRETFIPKDSGKHSDKGYKLIVSRTADPNKKTNSLRRQNRVFYINPGEIIGGSFLQGGVYETEQEAVNAVEYLKTSFAIFMLGIITPTPATTKKNYYLIPDVDFKTGEIKDKPGVFLDFNNSSTLDEELFHIFNINKDEQNLIKSSIKPWD